MSLLDYYHEQCQKGLISEDPQQLNTLQQLQRITEKLIAEHAKRKSKTAIFRRPKLIRGLYIWGGVGVGKTFLMDLFYQHLPFKNKRRQHFHVFMQYIHNQLTKHQGKKDPLKIIAAELAQETMVLCFDEFFVSDITDAMLLGRLLKALFDQGVTLITTSNVAPDDLYKYGLQRSQFLPAITMLKENTQIVHMTTVTDYRLRHLQEAGVFYTPLDAAADKKMAATFAALTQGEEIITEPLSIHGRLITTRKRAGEVVWFDFIDICSVPRSQKDYLALSNDYRTVLISNVPIITAKAKDMIQLFISLVDVFYDAHVRLVLSAAGPVEELYSRGYMLAEYTRTRSRLLEMQSMDYFYV